MSENGKADARGNGERIYTNDKGSADAAYMNRMFCSTKERVVYILKSSFSGLTLGKFDTGSDLFLYTIFGLSPDARANAAVGLGVYDMINDPLSALIIDKMRTRWGKFKPFQYLSLIPSLILGFITCMLPIIARERELDAAGRLALYMIVSYAGETVGAFFGGGGYIDNVFTPNPNERTALLVSAKFVSELFSKFPEQLAGLMIDLVRNNKARLDITNMFVSMKTFWWIVATIPSIAWTIVSRERVPQSEKAPEVVKGFMSVFRNKPMLIYTLSGLINGIDIGTSESLYYDSVLNFNMMPTIAGIPGMPISYASYPIAAKLRKKYSTKALWLAQQLSIFFSEGLFFLTGLIGGKDKGLYKKKIPMTIAMGVGNCIEMVFYATKKIVGTEINYEVLDYCEWKNGYRVEATINLMQNYFSKIRNIILTKINALLLEKWAGFQIGAEAVQTTETKWRMFITACGPHLIFDLLGAVPMLFYNIDKKTRERMYAELAVVRAATAKEAKIRLENESNGAESE